MHHVLGKNRNKGHVHVPYASSAVHEVLWMDTVGPLKDVYDRDNSTPYVLTIMDSFGQFSIAVAMPNYKSETVAQNVLNHWISIFGPPVEIRTDCGSEFAAKAFNQMCQENGIKWTRITPDQYNPIEWFHGC